MTRKKLLDAITNLDSQMRTKARLMCNSKQLGDDIWHDAVLKILTTYTGDDIPELNISGLLYSAMVSSLMDNKRRNGISNSCVELKYAEQEIINQESSIYSKLTIIDIIKYLDELNYKHREIFLMSAFGMDNKSISILMDESLENVRKIVFRVRSKIKNEFKHERN